MIGDKVEFFCRPEGPRDQLIFESLILEFRFKGEIQNGRTPGLEARSLLK